MYRDYAPKGVLFFYLYKTLAHPEHNGYVNPFTLQERLLHIREARRTLGSQIPWLCDSMDNDAKHALGNANNSEFVIDPEGNIARMRTWSDPGQLRRDLEELVGPVQNPTRVEDLDLPAVPPPRAAARGVVPGLQVPGFMIPVRVEPVLGDLPFYVKLRAEVEPRVLEEGAGKIYLGFHLDPLYGVHWNNLVDPVRYELEVPEGTTVSPVSDSGPQVEAESDVDPREFLVDIQRGKTDAPLKLTVYYYACNDAEGWCVPVTQQYAIHLERDEDGGRAMGRGGRGGRRGLAFLRRLWERDTDGDGRISRDEAPRRMQRRFDFMDGNGDGFIDEAEVKQMRERFRSGRGRRQRPDQRDRRGRRI